MTSKTLLSIMAISVLSLVLSACGVSKPKKKSEDVTGDEVSQYSTASCAYKYHEGPAAANRGLGVTNAYFSKRYNEGHLYAVLAASAAEVVRFAETTGVSFYKTGVFDSENCLQMSLLPMAPSDLRTYFTDVASRGVLGAYLGMNTGEFSSTQNRAAIVVRDDANKWILVHEFMHHLFQIQFDSDAGRRYDVKVEFREKLREFTTAKERLNPYVYMSGSSANEGIQRHLPETIQKFSELSKALVEFMKQFYLEEMTIESILSNQLDNGNLKLVLPGQRLNGAAYTIRSAERAQEIIESFKSEVKKLNKDFSAHMSYEQRILMSRELNGYYNIEREMEDLKAKARRVLSNSGIQLKGLSQQSLMGNSSTGEELHGGCSHEHEAEVIYNSVQNWKNGNL